MCCDKNRKSEDAVGNNSWCDPPPFQVAKLFVPSSLFFNQRNTAFRNACVSQMDGGALDRRVSINAHRRLPAPPPVGCISSAVGVRRGEKRLSKSGEVVVSFRSVESRCGSSQRLLHERTYSTDHKDDDFPY